MSVHIKPSNYSLQILTCLAIWTIAKTCLCGAQTVEETIDQLLSPYNRTDAPGLAVGVIKDGGILYSKGWGMADLENDIPITPDSVFDIASVSKQFAGLSIAILESKNKLNIDDPIRNHIKGLPDVFEPVLLRHLLHHTSGIRDWPGTLVLGGRRFDDVISFSNILGMARRQEALSFPPGETYSYSNTGYNLLARTVETITEQDFSSWIQANILEPLEMNHSFFYDDLGRIVMNRVRSYKGNQKGPFHNVGNQLMALGSSSLYSTVNDLLKWIRHFDNPKITSSNIIAKSMKPGSLNNGNSAGYAYGFGVGEYQGTKRISHSGGWAGFRTYLLYLPEFKFGVVVLSNWSGMNTSSIAYKVANIVLGEHINQNTIPKTKSTPENKINQSKHSTMGWEKWMGDYGETDKITAPVKLFERNEQPWINLPDGTGISLNFNAPTTFFKRGKNLTITCSTGINGWPRSLKIHSPTQNATVKEIPTKNWNKSELTDYIGVYQSSELLTEYRIETAGESLRAVHHRHAPVLLQRFNRDQFTSKTWYWAKVDFDRDRTGKVTGLRVTQGRNRNMVFKKSVSK